MSSRRSRKSLASPSSTSAISAVPDGRACTLLDFADPTCGFNPLAVNAPADVIADYVVGALKNLFSEDERAGRWAGSQKTECGIHLARAPGAIANVGGDI